MAFTEKDERPNAIDKQTGLSKIRNDVYNNDFLRGYVGIRAVAERKDKEAKIEQQEKLRMMLEMGIVSMENGEISPMDIIAYNLTSSMMNNKNPSPKDVKELMTLAGYFEDKSERGTVVQFVLPQGMTLDDMGE